MAVVFLSYYSCRVHLHVFYHFSNYIKHEVKCFIRYQNTSIRPDKKRAKTKKTKSGLRLRTHFQLPATSVRPVSCFIW